MIVVINIKKKIQIHYGIENLHNYHENCVSNQDTKRYNPNILFKIYVLICITFDCIVKRDLDFVK